MSKDFSLPLRTPKQTWKTFAKIPSKDTFPHTAKWRNRSANYCQTPCQASSIPNVT